jgi:hypothetical protein
MHNGVCKGGRHSHNSGTNKYLIMRYPLRANDDETNTCRELPLGA